MGRRGSSIVLRCAPYASVRAFELVLVRRGEPSIVAFDDFVHRGDVVIDVGAHRGVYSDRLAAIVGREGRVHAFEPNPDGSRSSGAWRGAGRTSRSTPWPCRIEAEWELLRPHVAGGRVDAMSSLTNPVVETATHDSVPVPLATLDAETRSEPGRIALVKIDVEGHEHEVLEGARTLIRSSRPVLVMEIEQRHRRRPLADTFAWLAARGYSGHCLTMAGRRPLATFDVDRDQLAYVGLRVLPAGQAGRRLRQRLPVRAGRIGPCAAAGP